MQEGEEADKVRCGQGFRLHALTNSHECTLTGFRFVSFRVDS